ncbi:MAG: dUTP diphosphatase [Eggerthellaceae bacterium]|nr:dUTP diphosphatase [Eggerthellaceae bacterium]
MMQTITVPITRLDKNLEMPAYAYVGDAGLDLRAAEDAVLKPFERKLVSCGIAIAIPEGHAGFVLPRSGLAAKHGISIVNAPGLIDSNYRGEVKAILVNLDAHAEFEISHGDRIAQLVIMPYPAVELQEAEKLDQTARGAGGFGSSGVSA